MKNTYFFRSILSVVAFSFITLLTLSEANAQGRYVGQYSKGQVDNIIGRVENSSNEFRTDFRRELDRSNLTNSQKSTYRRQVDNFENAADRLRKNFNSDNNWWSSRSQVQALIASAQPINTTMNSIGFRRNIERQWNRLRTDINSLADTFDLPGIAGGGWNGGGPGSGGGWGGGGGTVTPPSWAQGTFYGVAPNGSQIMLTISANGSVNANVGGGISYGTFTRGNILNIGGAQSRVTRQGNGITTTRTDNGERITYSRTGGGGNWGGGNNPGWGSGQQVAPPTWARGTFTGRAPNGTEIILTIDNSGNVTANVGGGMSYGSFTRGNYININGAISSVTSVRRGIRTTRTDNGEVIEYRKR